MPESDDLKTITALLENLIDRIEQIEENNAALAKNMMHFYNLYNSSDHKINEAFQVFFENFQSIEKKFSNMAIVHNEDRYIFAKEDVNARRHGEIDQWTGDLSRKLSDMQITLDRMENKKRRIFS